MVAKNGNLSQFDSKYNLAKRKMIRDAMKIMEGMTCVRFVERTYESDYMKITVRSSLSKITVNFKNVLLIQE